MLEKKFKAAVLEKNNSKLVIQDILFSGELKKGQIFVKLKYTGICGKQIDEIEGIGGKDPFMPHLLGHEGSGVVLKVGPGVKKVKKKDKIVLHWIKSDGIESVTPKYFSKNNIVNAGWITTFNEYAVVSENRVTKIPKRYSLRKSCLFGCVATTALGLVNYELKLKKKDTLLVVGVGGLGQIIVQAAKNYNVKKIIAIDLNNFALNKAKMLGADEIINVRKSGSFEKLKKFKINKSVITTGNIFAIEKAIESTSIPGTCFIMGVPKKKENIKINAWNIMHDQTIRGSLGGNAFPKRDIPKFIDLDKKGKINLNKIIFKVLKFKEINKGIKMFKSFKTTGRILIKF